MDEIKANLKMKDFKDTRLVNDDRNLDWEDFYGILTGVESSSTEDIELLFPELIELKLAKDYKAILENGAVEIEPLSNKYDKDTLTKMVDYQFDRNLELAKALENIMLSTIKKYATELESLGLEQYTDLGEPDIDGYVLPEGEEISPELKDKIHKISDKMNDEIWEQFKKEWENKESVFEKFGIKKNIDATNINRKGIWVNNDNPKYPAHCKECTWFGESDKFANDCPECGGEIQYDDDIEYEHDVEASEEDNKIQSDEHELVEKECLECGKTFKCEKNMIAICDECGETDEERKERFEKQGRDNEIYQDRMNKLKKKMDKDEKYRNKLEKEIEDIHKKYEKKQNKKDITSSDKKLSKEFIDLYEECLEMNGDKNKSRAVECVLDIYSNGMFAGKDSLYRENLIKDILKRLEVTTIDVSEEEDEDETFDNLYTIKEAIEAMEYNKEVNTDKKDNPNSYTEEEMEEVNKNIDDIISKLKELGSIGYDKIGFNETYDGAEYFGKKIDNDKYEKLFDIDFYYKMSSGDKSKGDNSMNDNDKNIESSNQKFKIGDMVKITKGKHKGKEGKITDTDIITEDDGWKSNMPAPLIYSVDFEGVDKDNEEDWMLENEIEKVKKVESAKVPEQKFEVGDEVIITDEDEEWGGKDGMVFEVAYDEHYWRDAGGEWLYTIEVLDEDENEHFVEEVLQSDLKLVEENNKNIKSAETTNTLTTVNADVVMVFRNEDFDNLASAKKYYEDEAAVGGDNLDVEIKTVSVVSKQDENALLTVIDLTVYASSYLKFEKYSKQELKDWFENEINIVILEDFKSTFGESPIKISVQLDNELSGSVNKIKIDYKVNNIPDDPNTVELVLTNINGETKKGYYDKVMFNKNKEAYIKDSIDQFRERLLETAEIGVEVESSDKKTIMEFDISFDIRTDEKTFDGHTVLSEIKRLAPLNNININITKSMYKGMTNVYAKGEKRNLIKFLEEIGMEEYKSDISSHEIQARELTNIVKADDFGAHTPDNSDEEVQSVKLTEDIIAIIDNEDENAQPVKVTIPKGSEIEVTGGVGTGEVYFIYEDKLYFMGDEDLNNKTTYEPIKFNGDDDFVRDFFGSAKKEIEVGDLVKVNIESVRQYDNIPQYLKIVRQIIKDADGTPYVYGIDKEMGKAEISSQELMGFGTAWVPVEALTVVKRKVKVGAKTVDNKKVKGSEIYPEHISLSGVDLQERFSDLMEKYYFIFKPETIGIKLIGIDEIKAELYSIGWLGIGEYPRTFNFRFEVFNEEINENEYVEEKIRRNEEDETLADLGVVRLELKKEVKASEYKTDKEIEDEFKNMKITEFEVDPKKTINQDWTSGRIVIEFPNAEESVGGGTSEVVDYWTLSNKGQWAFDKWYPESIRVEIKKYILDKLNKN